MGFFDNVIYKLQELQIIRHTRIICDHICKAYDVLNKSRFYSDDKTKYIERAIDTLPNWKVVGDSYFLHKKGNSIQINPSDNLKKAILKIIEVESYYMIFGEPLIKENDLREKAKKEVQKYFQKRDKLRMFHYKRGR